ncbi:hypothetical protein AMTRI_Chr04g185630 [Amborella trichopoda]
MVFTELGNKYFSFRIKKYQINIEFSLGRWRVSDFLNLRTTLLDHGTQLYLGFNGRRTSLQLPNHLPFLDGENGLDSFLLIMSNDPKLSLITKYASKLTHTKCEHKLVCGEGEGEKQNMPSIIIWHNIQRQTIIPWLIVY